MKREFTEIAFVSNAFSRTNVQAIDACVKLMETSRILDSSCLMKYMYSAS